MPLLGVRMFGQAVDLRQRRPNHIVNRTAEPAQFLKIVDLANLQHVAMVVQAARHSP